MLVLSEGGIMGEKFRMKKFIKKVLTCLILITSTALVIAVM